MRYARTSRSAVSASRAKTVIPSRSRGPPAVRALTAMTSAAGALNTTLFVPVSRKPSPPSGSARGLHARELVAGLALGEAERDLKLPGHEPGEPFVLDGAALLEEARADHRRCEVRLDGEAGPERLHHDRGLHRTAADPARLLRDSEPEPPELRELAPELPAEPCLARRKLAPNLEGILRGDELLDALAQQVLFVGEREVHPAGLLLVSLWRHRPFGRGSRFRPRARRPGSAGFPPASSCRPRAVRAG